MGFTGDTPFPQIISLLECFPECTFYDWLQFSNHIFLNLFFGLETRSFQSNFKSEKDEKSLMGLRKESRVGAAQATSDAVSDSCA